MANTETMGFNETLVYLIRITPYLIFVRNKNKAIRDRSTVCSMDYTVCFNTPIFQLIKCLSENFQADKNVMKLVKMRL